MNKQHTFYQTITDTIIAQLKQGVRPWVRETKDGYSGLPLRHEGTPYRGINVIILWIAAIQQGYSQPYWLTFKQGAALGGAVRKGEKSSRVTYFSAFEKESETGGDPAMIPFSKIYPVFNLSQFDGLDMALFPLASIDDEQANHTPLDPDLEPCRSFIANIPASISYEKHNRPCYIPSADKIKMPTLDCYANPMGFYSTVLHECGHWTGHTSRLNRDLSKSQFKTATGAFEELVAELTSAFICASLNREFDPSGNPATYIDGYMTLLKAYPNAIIKAAAEAQKAADFLITFQHQKEVAA